MPASAATARQESLPDVSAGAHSRRRFLPVAGDRTARCVSRLREVIAVRTSQWLSLVVEIGGNQAKPRSYRVRRRLYKVPGSAALIVVASSIQRTPVYEAHVAAGWTGHHLNQLERQFFAVRKPREDLRSRGRIKQSRWRRGTRRRRVCPRVGPPGYTVTMTPIIPAWGALSSADCCLGLHGRDLRATAMERPPDAMVQGASENNRWLTLGGCAEHVRCTGEPENGRRHARRWRRARVRCEANCRVDSSGRTWTRSARERDFGKRESGATDSRG